MSNARGRGLHPVRGRTVGRPGRRGAAASGATLRKDPSGRELTPSELRIASLVAEGHSNKDVGALLHLSPKTVEFHLGRVYRKVGVGNHTALARALRHASSGDDGE